MAQLLSLWPLALPAAFVAYKVVEHRKFVQGMYAHPTVEEVGKDFVRFSLKPIHPDFRSFHGPPTVWTSLQNDVLVVRGIGKHNECLEINQHFFYADDLLKGDWYKGCHTREEQQFVPGPRD
jgi:hypothetical protein